MPHRPGLRAAHHAPIDILDRTVEIDHRPRRLGEQQARSGGGGDRLRDRIDVAILESQTRLIGIA